MRRRLCSVALVLVLAGCEIGLSPGLAGSSTAGESSRRGCSLNVETRVATCACALPSDLAELPDRPDLVTLNTELDETSDASLLARLTHLRTLRAFNPSTAQVRRIASLSQIEHLVVATRSPIDFQALANMRQLRSLEIAGYGTEPVTLRDLEPLGTLPELTALTLHGLFPTALELEPMFPRAIVKVRVPVDAGVCAISPESCPPPSACERRASQT
jgi:hypothetical protein